MVAVLRALKKSVIANAGTKEKTACLAGPQQAVIQFTVIGIPACTAITL